MSSAPVTTLSSTQNKAGSCWRRAAIALACVATALSAGAAEPGAEVMLFGVFHFANPGQDAVRAEQIDVGTPTSQAYLDDLAQRLCAFKPTVILLEYRPSEDAHYQKQFAAYRAGQFTLTSNENHQIGFRVAKRCGVERIHGFDEGQVPWKAGPLFEYMKRSDPAMQAMFEGLMARLSKEETEAHRRLPLRELLLRSNDPARDRANKDLYLLSNAAGAGAGFEGADAAASWWHRNFRMYANIQHHARPGERVLVVAGQGHTAILRDLLAIDQRLKAQDIRGFL